VASFALYPWVGRRLGNCPFLIHAHSRTGRNIALESLLLAILPTLETLYRNRRKSHGRRYPTRYVAQWYFNPALTVPIISVSFKLC